MTGPFKWFSYETVIQAPGSTDEILFPPDSNQFLQLSLPVMLAQRGAELESVYLSKELRYPLRWHATETAP